MHMHDHQHHQCQHRHHQLPQEQQYHHHHHHQYRQNIDFLKGGLIELPINASLVHSSLAPLIIIIIWYCCCSGCLVNLPSGNIFVLQFHCLLNLLTLYKRWVGEWGVFLNTGIVFSLSRTVWILLRYTVLFCRRVYCRESFVCPKILTFNNWYLDFNFKIWNGL